MSALVSFPAPPRLPPRHPDGHKGTYGRVLVVAGSRGLTGAAVLCGSACLRGGAGLVTVATPADVQPWVALGNPCYMTAALPHHADGTFSAASADEVVRLAGLADVLAVGPGLGNRPDVGELVRRLVVEVPGKPTVLDADALNVLPPIPDEVANRSAPLVLTPHPGEFARLLGVTVPEVQAERQRLAADFARRWNAVVLLKGRGTVVSDGKRVYANATGNPGLATGGVGDVLTGLVAALIGQGLDGFGAACLAAHVHGRAGDLAAAAVGEVSLTAADVLDYLPAAIRENTGGPPAWTSPTTSPPST